MSAVQQVRGGRRGAVLVLAMIFLTIFSAMAVAMATMSGSNLQVASNQHKINGALHAAQSGLECAKYIVRNPSFCSTLPQTGRNDISATDATQVWEALDTYLDGLNLAGRPVTAFADPCTGRQRITLAGFPLAGTTATFSLNFIRFDSDPNLVNLIYIESTGVDGPATRRISMTMGVGKKNPTMSYAVAAKCRTWLAGDVTIHGNLYSAWKYQSISPFHTTSDSTVDGTINTILSNIHPTTGMAGPDLYAGTTKMPYDLETLDSSGNPVVDASGNRVINPTDEIQGQCQGINYGVNYGDKAASMPGMDLADYQTSDYTTNYKTPTTAIPSSSYNTTKVTEYAPHALGNYSQPGPSGGLKLTRYVCENKTLTNALVAANKNALFKNCTFNGILYVDGGRSGYYNNVRFDNCTFNGPIVTAPSTDTSSGWWQRNQLYFTGTATFQNQTTVPATIMAPNFSLDIGNTNPTRSENNVLTGAIIGGIVDIRGHAQVYGTIISMFDTSGYPSGYVSNIGATLGDGGSETTDPGDVGVITITPDPDNMLPDGIAVPIVITPDQTTYAENA